MEIDFEQLNDEQLLELCTQLQSVLDARLHKRQHLGEEVLVKGSLSKALKLPELIKKLSSKRPVSRQQARDAFDVLWFSLSEDTKNKTLLAFGAYDPKALDWEDPRSNKKPII